jgi:hypothetical protein
VVAAPSTGMRASTSRLVCYSLVPASDRLADHELQFELSVGSLRVHNPQIPVALFVHGSLPAGFAAICRDHRVMVHEQGSYDARLRALGPAGAAALAAYPVLHKELNFAELAATGVEQALCCDLDTLFFADVDHLFQRYDGADVVAREEVFSGRSIHGCDPNFIDEPLLAHVATAMGRRAVDPFNLGLLLYSRRAILRLAGLMVTFVDDAWRLSCGLACGSRATAGMSDGHLLPWIDATRVAMTASDVARAVPYPSCSGWLLDEIALWLTLGAADDLIIADFSSADVAQNGETFGDGATPPSQLACHYYSHNLPRVIEWLRAIEPVGVG